MWVLVRYGTVTFSHTSLGQYGTCSRKKFSPPTHTAVNNTTLVTVYDYSSVISCGEN